MGQTRVDLLHLLEDLRDAYPAAIEETILTEIVANSLDSRAGLIRIVADASEATLTVVDNGSGMKRKELARYHDLAASTKTRGQGIGFAGVGIKLGLLLSKHVLTETMRGKTHIASRWFLASRYRAPWKWTAAIDLVSEPGTAVRLSLSNPLSPLLDPGFIREVLQSHYQPLLDPSFHPVLKVFYPHGVQFEINGHPLEKRTWRAQEWAALEVCLPRKRKPSAIGYMVRDSGPLSEDLRGIAISTLGKVIKRGWDWLGVSPSSPENIGGLIEVPLLASCLTLNKGDFIRSGARGAAFLSFRKAIQEAVSRQLVTWGETTEPKRAAMRRAVRPMERDLGRVLEELADDFPLLGSLVERRKGGQKRLPMGERGSESDAFALMSASLSRAAGQGLSGEETSREQRNDQSDQEDRKPETPRDSSPQSEAPRSPGAGGDRKPARYGLGIQFENRPGDPELGRLVESTVYVNEAHPAYGRATASHSEGYHVALSVALALAPLAAGPEQEHAFVTAFLQRWGESLNRPRRRNR